MPRAGSGMSPEEVVRARSLRAHGYSARQIARVLGISRATAAAFVHQSSDADIRAIAGGELRACWVSAGWSDGLLVDERFGWPDGADTIPDTPGLAAVFVARYAGRDKVTACGYLIDLYCLGVKDVIGPRVLNDQQHAQFTRTFFAGYRQPPIAAPLELAQQLVLGAARYARSLGFDPAPGFDAVRSHLGEWSGVRAITFGRTPDHSPRWLRTASKPGAGSKPSDRAYRAAPSTNCWANSNGAAIGGCRYPAKKVRVNWACCWSLRTRGPITSLTPRQYRSIRYPQAVTLSRPAYRATRTAANPGVSADGVGSVRPAEPFVHQQAIAPPGADPAGPQFTARKCPDVGVGRLAHERGGGGAGNTQHPRDLSGGVPVRAQRSGAHHFLGAHAAARPGHLAGSVAPKGAPA